jgi:hypothetical protein
MKYAIMITDAKGSEFLLCEEGKDSFLMFDEYADADDFNYDFGQSLADGMSSAVIEFN